MKIAQFWSCEHMLSIKPSQVTVFSVCFYINLRLEIYISFRLRYTIRSKISRSLYIFAFWIQSRRKYHRLKLNIITTHSISGSKFKIHISLKLK